MQQPKEFVIKEQECKLFKLLSLAMNLNNHLKMASKV